MLAKCGGVSLLLWWETCCTWTACSCCCCQSLVVVLCSFWYSLCQFNGSFLIKKIYIYSALINVYRKLTLYLWCCKLQPGSWTTCLFNLISEEKGRAWTRTRTRTTSIPASIPASWTTCLFNLISEEKGRVWTRTRTTSIPASFIANYILTNS